MRLRSSWWLALVLLACTDAPAPAATHGEALSDPSPGMLPEQPEQLIERRADGAALYGTVLAVPRDADPERVMRLRAITANGAPLDAALDGARVLDARFAMDGVLTLGTDHVLRFRRGDDEVEIDARVEAPLSIAGDRVAYARGEMPFFELARADLGTLAVEAMTDGLAPVWSPALSPDGRSVVFASSASGHPRLLRLDPSGELTELGAQRTPSSPRAPRWIGSTLRFEDEAGEVVVDVTVRGAP